jgi:RNA:NAD 2'-phosphotransferase (TPT1/KptA family)
VALIYEIHTERINARCGHSVDLYTVTPGGTETKREDLKG